MHVKKPSKERCHSPYPCPVEQVTTRNGRAGLTRQFIRPGMMATVPQDYRASGADCAPGIVQESRRNIKKPRKSRVKLTLSPRSFTRQPRRRRNTWRRASNEKSVAVMMEKSLVVILHLLSIKNCNRGLLNSQQCCQRESFQAACILLRLPAVCRRLRPPLRCLRTP